MKEVYICPFVDVICFAPNKPIALENPGWGWEDDVFGESSPEPAVYQDVAEGGAGYED